MRNSILPQHLQEIAVLSKPDAQHQQVLDGLHSINASLKALIVGRDPFYQTVAISTTVPIDLDYRDRKHFFIFSQNALILTLEDLGTLPLSAGAWTNLNFAPGTRIFAQAQATVVYVGIIQTDEILTTTGALESGGVLTSMLTDFAELLLDTDNLAGILTQTTTTATDMAELLLDTDNLASMQSQLAKLIFDGNQYLKTTILNGPNALNIAANGAVYNTPATNNASVPTGAGNTVIKNSAGAITSIVVTAAGTGAGNVIGYDNATTNSGTPLAVIPATVSVGQQYQVNGWAKNGITFANVLNGPVFTVFFS